MDVEVRQERERVIQLVRAWWESVRWQEDLDVEELIGRISDGSTPPVWESAF